MKDLMTRDTADVIAAAKITAVAIISGSDIAAPGFLFFNSETAIRDAIKYEMRNTVILITRRISMFIIFL